MLAFIVTYVVAGVFVMTCTRARNVIAESAAAVSTTRNPMWAVVLSRTLLFACALLLTQVSQELVCQEAIPSG